MKKITILLLGFMAIISGVMVAKASNVNEKNDTFDRIVLKTAIMEKEAIVLDKDGNMCNGLFYKNGVKTDFAGILQTILDVIKYAAPILVLVFSAADFIKAIVSQDKDNIKKATKNSALRFGIAVSLYFLPLLINVLLNLFLGISDPTCGLS